MCLTQSEHVENDLERSKMRRRANKLSFVDKSPYNHAGLPLLFLIMDVVTRTIISKGCTTQLLAHKSSSVALCHFSASQLLLYYVYLQLHSTCYYFLYGSIILTGFRFMELYTLTLAACS